MNKEVFEGHKTKTSFALQFIYTECRSILVPLSNCEEKKRLLHQACGCLMQFHHKALSERVGLPRTKAVRASSSACHARAELRPHWPSPVPASFVAVSVGDAGG